MGQTQITSQPSVAGGLNLTSDILKGRPDEWIGATNCMVGRPGGGSNSLPGKFLAAMSAPPMRIPSAVTTDGLAYGVSIPKRVFVARGDITEPWTFTHGLFWSQPLSQGNSCLTTDGGKSQTSTYTLKFNTPLDISAAYQVAGYTLYMDVNDPSGGWTSITVTFYNSNTSNNAVYLAVEKIE